MTAMVATLLISRPCADSDEADELIERVMMNLGLDPDDPVYNVEWLESAELPPLDMPVHEVDQLLAHKRDAGPESVYFTVMIDDDPDPTDA